MCDVPCNIKVTHVDPFLHNKNRIYMYRIGSKHWIPILHAFPYKIEVTYVDPILDDSVAM